MEQDFLGLSSDYKRIRPNTLLSLKLSDNVISSIKTNIDDLKQKQEQEKNPKTASTKIKVVSKSNTMHKKKFKRKCSLLLRGGKIVKKVVLEKVSCPKAQMKATGLGGSAPESKGNNEFEFEFISTPFNEEIAPIKVSKLEKFTAVSVYKDQPAPPIKPSMVQPTASWNEMGQFIPYNHSKSLIPFPMDYPVPFGMNYGRDKFPMNPMQNFVGGPSRDKMNMSMNLNMQMPMMGIFPTVPTTNLATKPTFLDLE